MLPFFWLFFFRKAPCVRNKLSDIKSPQFLRPQTSRLGHLLPAVEVKLYSCDQLSLLSSVRVWSSATDHAPSEGNMKSPTLLTFSDPYFFHPRFQWSGAVRTVSKMNKCTPESPQMYLGVLGLYIFFTSLTNIFEDLYKIRNINIGRDI